MNIPPNLTLSKHAKWRMRERGISPAEIGDALASGHSELLDFVELHYDLDSRVAVLVNWQELTVVTVMYLCNMHYRKLWAQVQSEEETKRYPTYQGKG